MDFKSETDDGSVKSTVHVHSLTQAKCACTSSCVGSFSAPFSRCAMPLFNHSYFPSGSHSLHQCVPHSLVQRHCTKKLRKLLGMPVMVR